MPSKELHLCVVMSDSYLDIYKKIFLRTIPKEFSDINILHINGYDSEPGAVATQNFKAINYQKLEFIAQQLITHKGDNLLFLDLDIVCFQDFKDEINIFLEDYDMVFKHNPHYPTMPYCVGVWGLQCNNTNKTFFEQQVLPRAKVLLLTSEEIEYMHYNSIPVPTYWVHRLNGIEEHYGGDQCIVNAAILEKQHTNFVQHQHLVAPKVALLPATYTQDFNGGPNPKKCVLYHATGTYRGILEKTTHLMEAYENIKQKRGDA